MEFLVLAVRAIIIAVLLVSGFAKLLDRDGAGEAMTGFGMPTRFIPFGVIALPVAEIVLAVGLVFAATLVPSALLATLLFLAFTIAVWRVVLAGENLECHCFGQLSSGPVSRYTLVRNIALTIAAGVVWWWAQSREATPLWEHITWPVVGMAAVALLFTALGAAVLRLWRNQLELLDRIEELQAMIPAGRVAKPSLEHSFARITAGLTLLDVTDETVAVSSLKAAKSPMLLVFVSSGCRACNALMPVIAGWQREFENLMPVIVIGSGDKEEVIAKANSAGVEKPYFRENDELTARLEVNGNPTAVLIDHDGFIRAKPMLGGMAIRRAVEELRRQAAA